MRRFVLFSLVVFAACSSSTSVTGYRIEGAGSAVAGDALALSVVEVLSDGTTEPLGSAATVTWTAPATVTATDPTAANSPDVLPAFGADPTGIFLANPVRTDTSGLIAGVLFVLDAGSDGGGTLDIAATVSGESAPVTATVAVAHGPSGNASNGQTVYAANCAACHGATADGTPANTDGTYTIDGAKYDFPAPGLNNAPDTGNLGGDPSWNAALLAFAARADARNTGVALRDPMPCWFADDAASSSAPPTTQDFADIYAWLVSETQ